ncbi:RrF2 family transcriptional regulator [Elusimicrobiota bacterium]
MHISSQEEYGLRCLLQLAKAGDKALSIPEISKAEGITIAYAGKLLYILRKNGFIKSIRGPKGGYVLSRRPGSINAAEVIIGLSSGARKNSSHTLFACGQFRGKKSKCVHTHKNCGLRHVWQVIFKNVWEVLSDLTIADLSKTQQPVSRSRQ